MHLALEESGSEAAGGRYTYDVSGRCADRVGTRAARWNVGEWGMDGVHFAGVVLLLALALGAFGWLALMAGQLMRIEGLRTIRALLEKVDEFEKQRLRRAIDQIATPPPAAQKIMEAGEQTVAGAVKQVMKQ